MMRGQCSDFLAFDNRSCNRPRCIKFRVWLDKIEKHFVEFISSLGVDAGR